MAENAPQESTFMQKAWAVQHKLDRAVDNVKKGRFARILKMARKPEPHEWRQSATIVLVSMFVIGLIGFLCWWMMTSIVKNI